MQLRFVRNSAERPHVVEAVETIVNRHQLGKTLTSINSHPRSGKTSMIHGAALEFAELDVPFCAALAPWELLPGQMVDDERLAATVDRYCAPRPVWTPMTAKITKINDHRFYVREAHDPGDGRRLVLLATTIGLVYANERAFLDGIAAAYEVTGVRPVVFLDECHVLATGADGNRWGALVERMVEAGAYVVVLTGTAVRSDGKPVPGFTVEMSDETTERMTRIRSREVDPKTGQIKKYINTYLTESRKGKQTADFELSWTKGWKNGFLNQINVHWADAEIEVEGERRLVSEVTNQEAPGFLRMVVESDEMITEICQICADRLYRWRVVEGRPSTKMLLTTGSDVDRGKGDNYHARAVKRAIKAALGLRFGESVARSISVEIATTTFNESAEGKKAADVIGAFRGDKDAIAKVGEVDVLIVKCMGLVGLDVPELKVEGCLSTLRNGPIMLQERSRALTVWDLPNQERRPTDLVLPKDLANQRFIEKMKNAGGVVEAQSTLVGREEVKPEDEPRPEMRVNDSFYAEYQDIDGKVHEHTERKRAVIDLIRERYRTARKLTDVAIIDAFDEGAYPIDPAELDARACAAVVEAEDAPKVINLEREAANLRGKFGRRANELISGKVDRTVNPTLYTDMLKKLQHFAKQRAGVHVPVATIDDPSVLARLLSSLEYEFVSGAYAR